MVKNLLLVSDGTAASAPAFPLCAELAQSSKAFVQVLQVVEVPGRSFDPPLTPTAFEALRRRIDGARARAETSLHAQAKRHLGSSIERAFLVRVGPWSKTVLEVAREIGAHLILVPRTPTLAGATEELVRSAWRPVVVVPAPQPRKR